MPFVIGLSIGLGLGISLPAESPESAEEILPAAEGRVAPFKELPTRRSRDCEPYRSPLKGKRLKETEKYLSELYGDRRRIRKWLERNQGPETPDVSKWRSKLQMIESEINWRLKPLQHSNFSEVEDLLYRERCDDSRWMKLRREN